MSRVTGWGKKMRVLNKLCRHGWHSWAFVGMDDVRDVFLPLHSFKVCRLTERCRRCGLRRVGGFSPIPKRVKV